MSQVNWPMNQQNSFVNVDFASKLAPESANLFLAMLIIKAAMISMLSYPRILYRTMSTATKPLVLYHFPTPNGQQPAVFLKELKAVNSAVDYE